MHGCIPLAHTDRACCRALSSFTVKLTLHRNDAEGCGREGAGLGAATGRGARCSELLCKSAPNCLLSDSAAIIGNNHHDLASC